MGISGDYWSTFLNVDVDRTMYPADCYTPNTPEARPGRKGYLVNRVHDIIQIHKTNQKVISKTDMQILLKVRKSYQKIMTRKGEKTCSFSFTIDSVVFFFSISVPHSMLGPIHTPNEDPNSTEKKTSWFGTPK